MRPIRRTLVRHLLAALGLLLLVCNLALYVFVRSRLVSQFDEHIESKARALAGMTEQDDDEVEMEVLAEFFPEFQSRSGDRGVEKEYYQAWLETGGVLARSRSLRGGDLPRRSGLIDTPVFWNLRLPDDRNGRAIGIRFTPYQDKGDRNSRRGSIAVEMVLARERQGLDRSLRILLLGCAGTMGAMLGALLYLVPRLVRTGLRPLDRLARQAETIDADSLDLRFPSDGLPDELAPICQRLNALLDRLALAFAQEKRLTADIAHELKTPITELRSLAEVAARWPEDREFADRSLADALAIACQMQDMVAKFLALARCQSGQQAVARETVDLVQVVDEAWAPWRDKAETKRIRVEFALPDSASVTSDRLLAASILQNVFSNAAEYCPEEGRISCRLSVEGESARLRLTNTCRGLDRQDLTHIFEPLWRKDPSRSGGEHGGLGLALVRAFAGLLHVVVRADLTDEGDFLVALDFPRESSCP